MLLSGDAGLGKSRLVREIKEYVGIEESDVRPPVIEWRCSAYHIGSALLPAIEFFELLLEFARGDSPQDPLDTLVRNLYEFLRADPEQVANFASLLSIPRLTKRQIGELLPRSRFETPFRK